MRAKPSALFLFLSLLAFAAVAAPVPSVEKLLPDDTLFVATVPDFSRLREIYQASPQMQFWSDPAMKPFKDKFVGKLKEEVVAPLERELGIKLDDYLNLPQGQLTFAVTQNGWQGASDTVPAVLLLLDARDKGDQLKKSLADLRKKWLDGGKTLRTEKLRDIEFSIYSISDKDLPPTLRKAFAPTYAGETDASDTSTNQTKSELIVGQYQSLLILGTSTKAVEKVAAHLTGAALPSLGDLAAFESDRLALFRESPGYAWLNVKALIDIVTHRPAPKDSGTPDPFAMFSPDKVIAATGVGGIKSLAVACQNSVEGTTIQIFVGAPESARQGLLKVLSADPKEAGPPPFVPADAVKFQRFRIDGQKAWAALLKMVGDISPQMMGSVNFVLDTANAAAKQKDPDFDINKNLFGNLGDDVINYEKAPRGSSLAELRSPPTLTLIGTPHPDQFASALKSIFVILTAQGATPSEREFLGRKIYSVALPATMPGTSGRTLSYAAGSGYVGITMDASMLEDYLRSSDTPPKALRATAGFTDAAARVGGSSAEWFGYENQAETTRAVFEALRKSAGSKTDAGGSLLPMMLGMSGSGDRMKEWVDFSLLPPFEAVAKDFYFSVYSGNATVNGITFKAFAPAPPQLKK